MGWRHREQQKQLAWKTSSPTLTAPLMRRSTPRPHALHRGSEWFQGSDCPPHASRGPRAEVGEGASQRIGVPEGEARASNMFQDKLWKFNALN
mmetsp:Transcript_41544/g.89773  ORF Transcript_41544/g.89773 Transcript_41544/m.89773 type:complete len:93 (-) Transcript_41544:46-324(-)